MHNILAKGFHRAIESCVSKQAFFTNTSIKTLSVRIDYSSACALWQIEVNV